MNAKPADPAQRAGVYTTLHDVPDRYHLAEYERAYAGRDVYEEYLTDYLLVTFPSDSTERYARTAGRDWKAVLADRGRHHALAEPADVEAWCEALLDRVSVRTAYQNYWTKLERFYSWLQTHTDHPHVYHPFLMAARAEPAAGKIWAYKLETWRPADE